MIVASMNSEEYEHVVAHLLTNEGWRTHITPLHDKGLDVLGERDGTRLGVQAKMWSAANKAINTECVMVTYAACAYFDSTRRMIATDTRIRPDAEEVASKLGVEVRHVPPHWPPDMSRTPFPDLSFGRIWSEQVATLCGRILKRANGSTNEIVSVDETGITRRTSSGKLQHIKADAFRWTIERLIAGEIVLREDINDHVGGRASSGILLILASLPQFEPASLNGKQGLRLAPQRQTQ